MFRPVLLILPLLSSASLSPAAAQEWQAVPAVTRLAWGSVNVLIQPDSTHGTRLWVNTSSLGYRGTDLTFQAGFDPERLQSWLDLALAVVTRNPSAVADTILALQTPRLHASDGSQMVINRRKHKGRWEKRVGLLFLDSAEAHPWSIDATPAEAKAFIQALYRGAGSSRLQAASNRSPEGNPLALEACPVPLPGNPPPRYPTLFARRGIPGEVWMTFVVRADGTADPESFEALLYDDSAFASAAYQALRQWRFQPGMANGQPVGAKVLQRVFFKSR